MHKHLKNFSTQDFLWDLKYYAGRPDDHWYASLFEPGKAMIAGEITPAYSTLEREAVAHVHSLAPDAKIIFMMRNPIERAWSQAAMRFDKAGERAADASGTKGLWRPFEREGSRHRTDYLRTLENWGAYYPENRIFVGFLEDIHFFPEELLRRLYEFLGADAAFELPDVAARVHARSVGRVPTASIAYLCWSYRNEVARLGERFGGYADFWRHCAGRLSEDPPQDGEIPYPLWESYLWGEWSREARFQSGRLSEVGSRQG